MKHLFFVAVVFGFFAGTPKLLTAQTSVNIERINGKSSPTHRPKFIENIEITPTGSTATVFTENKTVYTTTSSIVVKERNSTITDNSIEKITPLQFKYAQLLDVEVETLTNTALYKSIEEWWATPYHYGGDDKTGIDCSAFCGKIFTTVFNITLPRTARDQYASCTKIDRADLQEGDLVFFNTRGGVSHVGVYLGNNNFAHSSISNGVTISSLNEVYYNKKFIGGGRVGK